ncbi:CTP synthase [Chloroflexota bacterium]
MARFIFCTGGVVSSVGKGVTAAALGRILKARGLKVAIQKLDPYLNVDPGTMSPYQHGEVFVTVDGAETDLDLGHYERFTDVNLTKNSNVTAGQVYAEVINKERRGDYLGGTIQVIPHITNEIKRRMGRVASDTEADVVIVEVGGTVGDIEGLPFLEALRQMRTDVGRDNVMYVHVTFLPMIGATGELKTKPTQHSVRELRSIGIQPDVIIARTDYPVSKEVTDKIALFCDVAPSAVIPLETASLLYEVPLLLEDAGLADYVVQQLHLEPQTQPVNLTDWRQLVERMKQLDSPIRIALVGKYVELRDAYMSVKEALTHAAAEYGHVLDVEWIYSGDLEKGKGLDVLETVSGIVVPGGFGERGVEGKILAAQWARENNVPYLGLCLGMQVMSIEFARNILGLEDANSTEFESATVDPIIDLLPDQRSIEDLGGTMRLGTYPCQLMPGSIAQQVYQQDIVDERHRHRFEFNNAYRDDFVARGMNFSGLSPDHRLVEIVELTNHPFMVGCQFHPEFASRPDAAHPLFLGFIGAAVDYAKTQITSSSEPETKS